MATRKRKTKKSKRRISSLKLNRWQLVLVVVLFVGLIGYVVYASQAAYVGEELTAKGNATWGGDYAKRIQVSPDGAYGFTMDIYGGIHPFRTYGPTPNKPAGGSYWANTNIARDFVVTRWDPNNPGGYVLDGFGGIHGFGGVAAPAGGPYWSGWDIARKLVVRKDGTGGYVMDAFAGMHPFKIGGNGMPPKIQGPYFSGQDIARDVVLRDDGAVGLILDCRGGVTPFSIAGVAVPGYPAGYPYDAKRCDYVAFSGVDWRYPAGFAISSNGNFAPFGPAKAPAYVDPGNQPTIDAQESMVNGVPRSWLLNPRGTIRAFKGPNDPIFTDKELAFFAEIKRKQEEEARRKAAEEAARRAAAANKSGGSTSNSRGGSNQQAAPGNNGSPTSSQNCALNKFFFDTVREKAVSYSIKLQASERRADGSRRYEIARQNGYTYVKNDPNHKLIVGYLFQAQVTANTAVNACNVTAGDKVFEYNRLADSYGRVVNTNAKR